ncbi:hypothetical protein PILCRDRAFT_820887 [Piloderma croceum F 1598]|uniref:Uncharacterized protein n=1 Tax=Piloderma croceum (strain F 1598) TaxID=765440 RepID=A0A0C3FQL0_PILCF|nr:hypothetical protein PILCRDRAFT_820887 [Piloderma croceum F 1598]
METGQKLDLSDIILCWSAVMNPSRVESCDDFHYENEIITFTPSICTSLPVLDTPETSVKTEDWDIAWGVTFVVVLRSTEYGACAGSVLSVLNFEGRCASHPAAAIIVSLDHDLIYYILRTAVKCAIFPNGPQKTTADIGRTWLFLPMVTSSHNATTANILDVSLFTLLPYHAPTTTFHLPLLDSSSHTSNETSNFCNLPLLLILDFCPHMMDSSPSQSAPVPLTLPRNTSSISTNTSLPNLELFG